jgi:predicted DsbA family dithiol-disulfide isomerase
MAKFPQNEFRVTWRPFQLNPDSSMEPVNKLQLYKEKFGAGRVEQMMPRMLQVFGNLGLQFSMGGNTGNTMTSHRLIQWAGSVGLDKQDLLVDELFKNYFCEEKFLGERNVLLAAVEKAGLDKAEGEKIIDNESLWRAEVEQDKAKYARGVSGVPYFIFNSKLTLSGGQPPEAFEEAIEEISRR